MKEKQRMSGLPEQQGECRGECNDTNAGESLDKVLAERKTGER